MMKKYQRVVLVTFSMVFMTLYAVNIVSPTKQIVDSFDQKTSVKKTVGKTIPHDTGRQE